MTIYVVLCIYNMFILCYLYILIKPYLQYLDIAFAYALYKHPISLFIVYILSMFIATFIIGEIIILIYNFIELLNNTILYGEGNQGPNTPYPSGNPVPSGYPGPSGNPQPSESSNSPDNPVISRFSSDTSSSEGVDYASSRVSKNDYTTYE